MKPKSPRLTISGWFGLLVTLLCASSSVHAATRTWDGGGADNFWTSATNWVDDVAPVAGDDLVFPAGTVARQSNGNNFPANTTFSGITLAGGGYALNGSALTLTGGIMVSNTVNNNSIELSVLLNGAQTFAVSNASPQLILGTPGSGTIIDTTGGSPTFTGAGVFQVQAQIIGSGGFTKTGNGSALLYTSNTFSGTVEVQQGSLSIYHANALGRTNGGTTVFTNGFLNLINPGTVPEPIILSGTLGSITGAKTCTGPITLAASNATIRVAAGAPLTINAVISGNGGFVKTDSDPLILNSNNTYTGTTTVNAGTLRINGSQANSPVVLVGGTLGGTGTVGTISVSGTSAKTLAPGASPGLLSSSNLTLNSATTFAVELNGTTAGTGYDQLNVSGTVNLASAILNASLGFTPSVGAEFVIINNDGGDAVLGTFAGLPEGDYLPLGGATFRITYAGGAGNNDVVLLRTNAPPATISSITRLGGGEIQLRGLGWSNLVYGVEAATNLTPVIVWTNLGAATANSSGVFSFTNANAPLFPMRFYRALSP